LLQFYSTTKGEHGEWRKVEFGKPGGELFPVWSSTPWDLREFGLGVAMYFQTLQLLSVTMFICGVLNAQAIEYYKSPAYSAGQAADSVTGKPVPGLLKGSAICTEHEVVCLDWECWTVGTTNECNLSQAQAWLDLTMTVFLLALVVVVSIVQDNISASLDESLQTAQDYSVIVDDPTPEDGDPDEWANFFGQFGHVTFVTVARANGPLIKLLAERRAVMREIIMMIGNGQASVEEDDDGVLDTTWNGKSFKEIIEQEEQSIQTNEPDSKAKIRLLIAKTGAFKMFTLSDLRSKLAKVNEQLQALLEEPNFPPSKVFITFETEQAQRRCLRALSQGTLVAAFDMNRDKMDPAHIFKGTNVLSVLEAPEPMEVFYEDVQVDFQTRVRQQSTTFMATLVLVFGSVLACKLLQIGTGPSGAAIWISVTNIAVPIVIRMFVFKMEDHVSLNDQQLSLFLKLTFFRWMNTAVVIYLITNFTELLKQVQAVIIADAIITPLVRTLNPSGAINQLIISNYALTQEKMNSYFLGTPWDAAERYADMTKTLFLALFYSALFPSGLFLTCFGYSFCYTVDKYSLLRQWRTPAELDVDITKVARYHLAFSVYCHAIMSLVFYAEFPFDNACVDQEAGTLEWWRFRDAKEASGVTTDQIYKSCDQTVSAKIFLVFFGQSLANDAMNGKQVRVVRTYCVLVAILTAIFFVAFFGKGIVMTIYYLYNGNYRPETEANDEHFTECDIQAYIPNITHPSLAYPLIACDVKSFNSKYLPFELPKEELYKIQSLFNRKELPGYTDSELNQIFSIVKYYPPPENLAEDGTPQSPPVQKGGYAAVPKTEES